MKLLSSISPIQTRGTIGSVRRFYFLEYFYVLLKSIERHSDRELAFDLFKILKQKHRLGESKYKTKLDSEELSPHQLNRYRYTFSEVIEESIEYELIAGDSSVLSLSEKGEHLLHLYDAGNITGFNRFLFSCMEERYGAFRIVLELLYAKNRKIPELLIFPNYSPRQLKFQRSTFTRTKDVIAYSDALLQAISNDIDKYLGEKKDLNAHNAVIMNRLYESGLLPPQTSDEFKPQSYNAITKRFRDYWQAYFLREIYGYEYSLSSFERWLYRGKQIGILYATDFYPSFTGRIVYPTALVIDSTKSSDFVQVYDYRDGKKLYIHEPNWDVIQEKYVDALVESYFDLRRSNRSYFINLLSLREIVCYKLKIPEFLFERYLDRAYKLNLAGQLKVKISLEVDKLPEETSAIYLKREPVMIDGKYRNIIAIDVDRGGK